MAEEDSKPQAKEQTFVRAKNALFRRAADLNQYDGTQVAVIVFGPDGKLYQFANDEMEKVLGRYSKKCHIPHETRNPEKMLKRKAGIESGKDVLTALESLQDLPPIQQQGEKEDQPANGDSHMEEAAPDNSGSPKVTSAVPVAGVSTPGAVKSAPVVGSTDAVPGLSLAGTDNE